MKPIHSSLLIHFGAGAFLLALTIMLNPNVEKKKLVDKSELNLWKRGFTPQAEIWNGRMATVGIGIIFIIISLISLFSQ